VYHQVKCIFVRHNTYDTIKLTTDCEINPPYYTNIKNPLGQEVDLDGTGYLDLLKDINKNYEKSWLGCDDASFFRFFTSYEEFSNTNSGVLTGGYKADIVNPDQEYVGIKASIKDLYFATLDEQKKFSDYVYMRILVDDSDGNTSVGPSIKISNQRITRTDFL